MDTVVSVVVWGVELALAVALVWGVFITLAFSSEAHKNRMGPFQERLHVLSLLVSLIPIGVTLWAGYLLFLSGRPDARPLGLGLPLAASVGCGLTSLLLMFLGEKFSQVGVKAQTRHSLAQARQRAEAGELEFACHVLVLDPAATAEDMRRFRAYMDSLPRVQDRELAFSSYFVERQADWRTWNPQEVGLSPFRDPDVALAIVHHDQAWFLRTYLECLLSYQPALPHLAVATLHSLLRHLNPASGWSPAALESLRPYHLPELLRRLEPREGVFLGGSASELKDCRQWLTALVEEGPKAPPPLPALAAPLPPESIGVVRRAPNGDLEFWMRATATVGHPGDVYFRHSNGNPDHARWMAVLGSPAPGLVRPVPPLKAA